MAGVTTGDQFTLLKASAVDKISQDLRDEVSVFKDQAQVAALAAGAPLVTALTSPVPDNGAVEALQTGPGVKVFEVVGGAWSFAGWLSRPSFESVSAAKLDASPSYGGDGSLVEANGHKYVQDSAAPFGFIANGAGVKLRVLPGADGQYGLAAWGKSLGDADNVAQVTDYLRARQTVLPQPCITRNVPRPKLNLISPLANGKNFQGFPSAVRHDGKDFILYREGLGHTETAPFGSKARLVCAVRPVNGIAPTSTTEIFAETDVDPRDPNVLRDDYGNAILVGGVFKVVIFEWAGSYEAANVSAKVYDLDPDNLAAGLVNPVSVPSPVQAVKSDVRQLSNGDYAFVGYSIAGNCYLVTTSDWATFSTELIGPGNEAAFCETYDGALNVVVRAEERFGAQATIFYKKQTGGSWYVHDILPYTLNAPTLVKAQGLTVVSGYPDGNEGWLMFARDKTGRTALTNVSVPTSELVCLRSKQDFGQEIIDFTDRKVICGTPTHAQALSGDNHYCSVISGGFGNELQIYTYSEFKTTPDLAGGSAVVEVWRIEARLDPDEGIRTIMPDKRNYFPNGEFEQGATGHDLTNANATLVVDPDLGRNVLNVVDAMTSQVPFTPFTGKKGETLFLKVRMKLVDTNLSNNRHIKFILYDASGGTAVTIQSEVIVLDPVLYEGNWHTVICRPFVCPSDKLALGISTEVGVTAAESDIAAIEVSDFYADEILPPVKVEPLFGFSGTSTTPLSFAVTSGATTAKATAQYSNAVWAALGLRKKLDNLPYPAVSVDDIQVDLVNATTQLGALRVICTSAHVDTEGKIIGTFAVAPGESGTMASAIQAQVSVKIKVKQ